MKFRWVLVTASGKSTPPPPRYNHAAPKIDQTFWYSADKEWLALESIAKGGHVVRYELS